MSYDIDRTCLVTVAEYILDTERENYLAFCEENGHPPAEIWIGIGANHVYAIALRGLGLEYNDVVEASKS
jgi:hypothetical protein